MQRVLRRRVRRQRKIKLVGYRLLAADIGQLPEGRQIPHGIGGVVSDVTPVASAQRGQRGIADIERKDAVLIAARAG